MKILLSFLQDNGGQPHAIPAYRFWTYYIKNGIEEAGMQWTEIPGLDWAAGLVPYENDPALQQWKQQAWEKTINHIKANRGQIDVFLCYLYPKQIDAEAIKQIKAMGVPCVNFYCDNVRSFIKLPRQFKVFDLVWVPEFEALHLYQKTGVPHINLPMPMWVDPKYRHFSEQETDIISFIGSKDDLRAQLLADAIAGGVPIQIRGNGWNNGTNESAVQQSSPNGSSKIKNQFNLLRNAGIRGFVAYHRKRNEKPLEAHIPPGNIFEKPGFDEYIGLSRQSVITLGINRVPTFSKNLVTYSRLRDLEAPMLGACYLTEYTAGLSQLYDLGTDIETYTNADELVYKCRELMASKNKRKELRIKGQQRALDTHSIPQSLQLIKTRLF
ncbi:glycosyltransferase family protein [Mucilaginibacter ginsenosidivorax]|uniref:Glycosyltransferase family 1 protein n=1 Tax=Mucilaginibacter ginsenosidivorax TaxID=862126 RepID=A0A5B8W2G5_9SPHI|nr:glycosyltransferase [Mucilaginibacter ginsenosidivorax]QEC77913.1 glycosyltransferase family 1 protein [Mucilaginibacter ginsenosidivorax]